MKGTKPYIYGNGKKKEAELEASFCTGAVYTTMRGCVLRPAVCHRRRAGAEGNVKEGLTGAL